MLHYLSSAAERLFGVKITRIAADREARLIDLSPEMRYTIERAGPYTMTSPERLAMLCMAVEHVVQSEVPGAFVECGVWKGGSSMAAAWTFMNMGKFVDFFLFDTFEGMSEPGKEDVSHAWGKSAAELLADRNRQSEIWAYAEISSVRRNMEATRYPAAHLHFVKGKVEETIPTHAPEKISLLRLDTDWYASTRHELVHLFPRLSPGGILIIDDYGHWAGARKAVDEYFADQGRRPFLARIDNTARVYVNS